MKSNEEIQLPECPQKMASNGIMYPDPNTLEYKEYNRYIIEELQDFECCQSCRFWLIRFSRYGYCRLRSPYDGTMNRGGRWPETSAQSWCGEWELVKIKRTFPNG